MIIIRNDRKPRYFCCPNFFLNNNSFVKQLAKKGIHKEAEAQKIVPELPRFQVRDCALVDQVQSGAWVGVSSVVGCVCFCIFGLVLSYSLQRIVSEDQRSSFKRKVWLALGPSRKKPPCDINHRFWCGAISVRFRFGSAQLPWRMSREKKRLVPCRGWMVQYPKTKAL